MIPWRRKWQRAPVFLPEKFYGRKSLAGSSPWGHRESDTAEHARMKICVHIDTFFLLGLLFKLKSFTLSLKSLNLPELML